MRIIRRVLLLSLFVLVSGLFQVSASEPVVQLGNPTCEDLGCAYGFKIDPPVSGTYQVAGFGSVTVTIYRGTNGQQLFDWTSTFGINKVIAKGGNAADVYSYSALSTSDTGLHAPVNSSGKYAGLSHISFCYGTGSEPD